MTAPAKRLVRRLLDRAGYELVPDPYVRRLTRLLAARGITHVIDGGGNVGQFALGLRGGGYRGHIVSVEPQQQEYEQLAAAAAKDTAWDTVHAALAAEPGTIEIHIAANSVSSSPLPMHHNHLDAAPDSSYVGTQSVRATTIDAIVDEYGIDPATAMLKLDIQGYERYALEGAAEHIDRFAAVNLELAFAPIYDGGWLAREATEYMLQHGFQFWMMDPQTFSDPATGRLLAGDGLYVPQGDT